MLCLYGQTAVGHGHEFRHVVIVTSLRSVIAHNILRPVYEKLRPARCHAECLTRLRMAAYADVIQAADGSCSQPSWSWLYAASMYLSLRSLRRGLRYLARRFGSMSSADRHKFGKKETNRRLAEVRNGCCRSHATRHTHSLRCIHPVLTSRLAARAA